MKKTPRKRCCICNRWYKPDPRTAAHQRCCSRSACKKAFKRQANKSWCIRHSGYDRSRRLKKQDWAQRTGYWRRYRREHPAYREREKRRMQKKRDRAQRVANQDAIRDLAVETLRGIPRCEPGNVANQALMDRRVDTMLEYLLWKEGVANQDGIGIPRTPVP